jgi:hypothetical protein
MATHRSLDQRGVDLCAGADFVSVQDSSIQASADHFAVRQSKNDSSPEERHPRNREAGHLGWSSSKRLRLFPELAFLPLFLP